MPDFLNPSEDLLAGLQAGRNELNEAIEAEQARWQEAIYAECVDTSGHKHLDGSGCDSGDPLDLTVTEVGMAIGYVIDQRDELKADLAAAQQKHAALVEAVKAWNKQRIECEQLPWHRSQEMMRLLYLRDQMIAIAQQDQPAGKWITINEDGSNLPEHVEGAEWCVYTNDPREHLQQCWTNRHPSLWLDPGYIDTGDAVVVDYWSEPYVPSTFPAIPERTAR